MIADYEGTVLLVSHDRDFLDRTVTVTLGLDGSGKVDVIAGGYAEWEAKRKQVETNQKPAPKAAPAKASSSSRSSSPAKKLSYKDQRDYDLLPTRIEAIDQRMAEIDQVLADPDLYTRDFDRFDTLTKENSALIEEKDAAEMRWLELAEEVERLNSN